MSDTSGPTIYLWPHASHTFEFTTIHGRELVLTTPRKNRRFARKVRKEKSSDISVVATIPLTTQSIIAIVITEIMSSPDDTNEFTFIGTSLDSDPQQRYSIECCLSLTTIGSWIRRTS